MEKSSTAFVGMDVHKESVDIAIADGRQARLFGRVGGDAAALERAVRKIRSVHRDPLFVTRGGALRVPAVPKAGGARIALHGGLALDEAAARGGPGEDRPARCVAIGAACGLGSLRRSTYPMREMRRCAIWRGRVEDAVCMQRLARQRLQALLLRNEIRDVGRSAWTQAHRRWIAHLKLPDAAQQIAFEEYVTAVEEGTRRLERLEGSIGSPATHRNQSSTISARSHRSG